MSPRLLSDILLPPSERLTSYHECLIQAFTTHMYVTTSHTVLMIMAFDRYVAICNPLRYASIMTNKMMIELTVLAWGVAFVLVGVLLGLTIRLSRCRTMITNPFCDPHCLSCPVTVWSLTMSIGSPSLWSCSQVLYISADLYSDYGGLCDQQE